ncbi:hypothetical protein SAMN04487910_2583 [Aquimarina amphilecti]|uniref:Uncharacterized protein n=1 Tax=Aquimarina amphilecti TaxID=1038014 RepID=A0A1H7QIX9_AQUAM|nr:hypothetical protein [Aquimarina amphilecti]SEL48070.1 hypothetical protein SAMN04487910_2583 [Aquimarina amphilecti]
MIENITFLHSNWMWQIGCGALVLWLVFVWKELSLWGKPKFWIRITVALLAVISITIIALKPARSILPKNTKVALLTSGYERSQLDSLKNIYKRLQTVDYIENQPIFGKATTSDTVFVLGSGVAPFDFWQLANNQVQYVSGDIPTGIIRYTYDQEKVVGAEFGLEGIYNNPIEGNRLLLEGPGGNGLDSINLVADAEQSFSLRTKLKASGTYIFWVTEKDATGKIVAKDPIPMKVQDRKKLQVLIVNDFPTFETKYLKNYLSEMGHEVLVKSKITKGKYKFEYFNRDRTPMGAFTEKNLSPFDLVILDANTIKNLGRNATTALENAVRQQGLGVFIQPDETSFRSRKGFAGFDYISVKRIETKLPIAPKTKITTYPFVFNNQTEILAVHRNTDKKIISGYKYIGKGKVGTTVIGGTYELILDGNTQEYQQLWAGILTAIAKKETAEVDWDTNQLLAIKDQPYITTLRTKVATPEVIIADGYRIAMQQDIHIPNRWQGTTYPKKLGWHQISIAQDSSAVLEYYVTDTIAWRSQLVYDKMQQNSRFFDRSIPTATATRAPVAPINPIGLYIFFLCCMGYLWLVPKIETT